MMDGAFATSPMRCAPALMCLNLQDDHVRPGHDLYIPAASKVLSRAQSCIAWARRAGLTVLHVHTLRGRSAERCADLSPPIAGFEPLASEPVILKRGPSIFDSHELRKVGRLPSVLNVFVLGFTAAQDCLAAATDAAKHGARLVFISDAIASPALPPFAANVIDDVLLAILGQFAGQVSTEELTRRPYTAGNVMVKGVGPLHLTDFAPRELGGR